MREDVGRQTIHWDRYAVLADGLEAGEGEVAILEGDGFRIEARAIAAVDEGDSLADGGRFTCHGVIA